MCPYSSRLVMVSQYDAQLEVCPEYLAYKATLSPTQ